MSLTPGTRLGPYEVTAPIGVGGMGEVYRATDTNLKRSVAIKVLPEALAGDAERLARFQREAEVLASLNHPNIAAIYGLEKSDAESALVMELVEGPTLADRIASGPIPIDDALPIAKQVAEALEAAHKQGIIHRDLKPANIKVRPDGTVKVLDFGLAKAMEPPGSTVSGPMTPTITTPAMTRAGMILGTPAYMSPEQTRGQPVDPRTDVWAFGCVLFEMLTGVAAFRADTPSDSTVRVLDREPDWTALPHGTPDATRRLLGRCLKKDLRLRLRDMGDVGLDLLDSSSPETAIASVPAPAQSSPAASRWTASVWLAAVVLVVLAVIIWTVTRPAEPAAEEPTRLTLSVPRGQEGLDSLASSPVLISPDGRTLVYPTRTEDGRYLYRRSLDAFDPVRIPGTEGAETPFFSVDGKWIGFRADGQLKKVRLEDGETIPIAPVPALLLGASWGPDDTIVYATGASTGLWRVPAAGGEPEQLTAPMVEMSAGHRFPYQLPGRLGVLFSIGGFRGRPSRMAWLPVGSDEWQEVYTAPARITAMRYLPTGHLVFGQDGTIFAGPFDLDRVAFTAQPVPVIANVASSPTSAYVAFDVSDTGTLVYVPATEALGRGQLVRIVSDGSVDTIARLPGATGAGGLRVSPAGDRAAVLIRSGGVSDIWAYGLDRGDSTRVTQGAEAGMFVWRPDGRTLTIEMHGDLYDVAADGAGQAERLLQREGSQTPLSWSADGRLLLFREFAQATGDDLFTLDAGTGDVTPVARTRADETDGVLSADGSLLAYVSDETGNAEVYLQPLDGSGRRQPVSVGGGDTPRWSARATALLYRHGSTLMRVPVTASPLRLGPAEIVLSAPEGVTLDVGYGVAGDGQTVVGVRNPSGAGRPTELRVVLGWFEELKRLVPTH